MTAIALALSFFMPHAPSSAPTIDPVMVEERAAALIRRIAKLLA